MGAGIGLGSMASPPLAGLLFEVGPLYVLYLVGGLSGLQGILVIAIWHVAGYTCIVPPHTEQTD